MSGILIPVLPGKSFKSKRRLFCCGGPTHEHERWGHLAGVQKCYCSLHFIQRRCGAQDARLKMFSKWQFPGKDPPVATHCFTCMEETSAVLVKDLVNTTDLCQSVLHLHIWVLVASKPQKKIQNPHFSGFWLHGERCRRQAACQSGSGENNDKEDKRAISHFVSSLIYECLTFVRVTDFQFFAGTTSTEHKLSSLKMGGIVSDDFFCFVLLFHLIFFVQIKKRIRLMCHILSLNSVFKSETTQTADNYIFDLSKQANLHVTYFCTIVTSLWDSQLWVSFLWLDVRHHLTCMVKCLTSCLAHRLCVFSVCWTANRTYSPGRTHCTGSRISTSHTLGCPLSVGRR